MYSSPIIIRKINLRRMRRVGNVARMGEKGTHRGSWWDNQKERDY
jgi:hypothetical protein